MVTTASPCGSQRCPTACAKLMWAAAQASRGGWDILRASGALVSAENLGVPGLSPTEEGSFPSVPCFPNEVSWLVNIFRNPVVCRHGSVPHESCHSGSGSFWGLRQTHQTWQTRCSKTRCLCAMFLGCSRGQKGNVWGTCLKFWDIAKMFCLLIIEKLRNVFLLPIMCSI